METIINELRQIGFSEKEAVVYVAALMLGPSSAQDIAKKSGVNRATTYLFIDSLIKKGLVSTFLKNNKKFFNAESPDRLLSLIRLQKHELEEREQELTNSLPRLMAIYNAENVKPQIRYFEGLAGAASIMKFFEDSEGEFVEVVSIDDVERVQAFFQHRSQHLSKLSQKKISYRLLAVMNEPDFSKVSNLPGGEVRLIPADKFPLKGDISVRGNTVFMHSFQDQIVSVVITSMDLANSIRQLFNIAWEGSSGYMSEKR